MKNRTDKILLEIFLLSLLAYVFLVLCYLDIIPTSCPDWLYTIFAWFALGFHAVPAFCLQLFLCRRRRRWLSALPGLVTVGAALWFTYGFFTATGWDALGWGLLMLLSIAPAAGCVLGWAVFGFHQLRKRGTVHG